MMYKAYIFYCSPAGTTRHIAGVMEKKSDSGGSFLNVGVGESGGCGSSQF